MLIAQNLAAEFAKVTEYWSPKVVAQMNDQYLKVAKGLGDLVWHKHDEEDEFFYIVKGQLVIEFPDDEVVLGQGDFYVVPTGVTHRPVAAKECWFALIEKATTQHTGDARSEQTKPVEQQVT